MKSCASSYLKKIMSPSPKFWPSIIMNLENGFILAAGLGTRMGQLGKTLPKPLWPVFEKTLLELSITTLKELGVSKIFVNTHHQSDKIERFIHDLDLTVHQIHERELLGSGGAFHNLKAKYGISSAVALNSDCLYIFDKSIISKIQELSEMRQFSHVLLGQKINKGSSYNSLKYENNVFKGIGPPDHNKDYWTFSGVSYIDFLSLEKCEGVSSFFDTVANPDGDRIALLKHEIEIEDLGTLEKFEETILNAMKNKKLRDFLINLNAFDEEKYSSKRMSYNSQIPGVINMTGRNIGVKEKGLYIEDSGRLFRIFNGQATKI